MKYIRMKDGRILTFTPKKKYENDKSTFDWFVANYCGGINVLKVTDTIEELCDEAVFFDDKNKPHYKSQEGNIWFLGASLFTETLRFGIFTDKGLIYVAKMNDKGELELL